MKKLLILLVLAVSSTVMACPNLAGEYQCYDDESGYYTMALTQSGTGTNTVYTTVEDEGTTVIKADNQWHSSIDESGTALNTKGSCQGSNLKVDLMQNNPNVGEVKMSAVVSLNASGELTTVSTVTVNGQNYPTESSACTRI